MSRRSILLVDDQIILLDVLRRRLESDPRFDVVGEASSGSTAIELAAEVDPEIVMLDVDLGHGESGFDVAAKLRQSHSRSRIVMVSMFEHPMYRDRAFEVGADAYATKGIRFEELCPVLLGDCRRAPACQERYWLRPPDGRRSAVLTLTRRELRVVQMLSAGMREKEAAEHLAISVSSVGTYLRRAMDKMGFSTRGELFQMAAAMGTETLCSEPVDVGEACASTGE